MQALLSAHDRVGGRVGVVDVDGDVLRDHDVASPTLYYTVCTSRKGSAKTYSPAHKANLESRICFSE